MKKLLKTASVVAFSLAFCFLAIGYAKITSSMSISGEVSFTPPHEVYIYNIDSTSENAEIVYSGTVVNSTVTLGNSASSTVSMTISVTNQTSVDYVFKGASVGSYSNSDIVYSFSGITAEDVDKKIEGTPLKAGGKLDFVVTFSYKNNAVPSNKVLSSVINYSFGSRDPNASAIDDVTTVFEAILNNSAVDENNNTQFQQILNKMDERNHDYLGNVVGGGTGSGSDSEFVTALFAYTDENGEEKNHLMLEINGKSQGATAMIKYEDITGDGVADMVLYLTAETISGWNKSIDVYAAVYVKNSSGVWKLRGPLFEGTAKTNNYNYGDSFFGQIAGANSFDTDDWRSKSLDFDGDGTYEVSSNTNITNTLKYYQTYEAIKNQNQ